jgi:hypothetical protein
MTCTEKESRLLGCDAMIPTFLLYTIYRYMLTYLGLLASEYEGSTLLQISVNIHQSTGRLIADNLNPDQHHCGNL